MKLPERVITISDMQTIVDYYDDFYSLGMENKIFSYQDDWGARVVLFVDCDEDIFKQIMTSIEVRKPLTLDLDTFNDRTKYRKYCLEHAHEII